MVTRSILPAAVQPVLLEDVNQEGGVQVSERLKAFVPVGIERTIRLGEILTWNHEALTLGGEPLRWGGGAGELVPGDRNPLLAAFEDREADEVEYAGYMFVVEESVFWPNSHCRVILLRET